MRQKKSRVGCGKIVLSNNANPITDVDIDDNDNDDVSPQKLDIQRVTASSNHPGPYGCENVLNGRMGQDGGADWSTRGEGPGAWIQLDLGWPTMHTVTQLKFAGRVRDDKFKTVRLSFSDGSSQELEFPNNTLLNSFDLSPAVSTTFVRITCLTCYNTSYPNRGAQAIELWGFGKNVTGQLGMQEASRSGSGAGEIVTDVQTVLSVHGNAVEEADDGIPVITFRRGDDDDNDICAIIDGSTLNKDSTMESVMESEDVCQELGVVGLPSEYKFFVKRKEEKSSSIPLRWNQFRSMTVHKLSRLQNIDTNYLVTMKEKSLQCKVEKAKLEDLSKKVLSVSKLVNELINSNPEGDRTRGIPLGNYYIKTTYHEQSGQAAGWGLSAWQLHGGARNSASSWVATHEGGHWPCVWSVEAGKKPNTYRIKTHQHVAGGQPAGWGLSAWQLHGGRRNGGSSRVAVHNGDHWPMDWEIVPGKKDGTWRVLTTEHTAGGQPAGWGLSSWGHKVRDTTRNCGSNWVHVHEGDDWPMDWVFERVETHD